MPSGVLYIAFQGFPFGSLVGLPAFSGLPGQIFTQGASEQWLHSTGITQCVVFGKVPSVFIRKSAQLKLCP